MRFRYSKGLEIVLGLPSKPRARNPIKTPRWNKYLSMGPI